MPRARLVGISAVAMDYFGRTAGLTPRDEKFDFMAHVQQIRLPGLYADTNALSYRDPDPEPEPHRPRLPAHADQRRSEKRAPPA